MCATTTKLFLTDSHVVDFSARVLKQLEDSGKSLLTLSETAFYPTSGGQPHDNGTIAGVNVVDVYEMDGEIFHVLDQDIELQGVVTGEVNWTRRHDHMQQHTGQHILSQALIKVCDIPTVGFTIGPDWSTIVIEKRPDAELLESALGLANAVVDDNRPIEVLLPSQAELVDLPIRGALPNKEAIRIIKVEGFDWSPCGGTHSKTTGDVRLIQILGIRKEKDTYRLEFVCGRRAEKVSMQNSTTVSEVAALLDVGPSEVVDRTQALMEKLRVQEKTIDELREARLTSDCERILAAAKEMDHGTVAMVLEDRTIQELRQLGRMLVEQPGLLAVLVGKDQDKVGLAFAKSTDRNEDMNEIMKRVCSETGCRGGGNPSFATGGGGGEIDTHQVLEAAKQALAGVRE